AEEERQQRAPSGGSVPAGFTPLDQPFDGGSLYALRSAVTAHAAAAGMGRHQVYDVTAVAHELAANAVQHGAGPVQHGHGLWLTGQIADHVGVGHGPDGTTATVRFLLSPE